MKLASCLEKIDDIQNWEIRFYEDQPLVRPNVHTVMDNLHRLFHGWLRGGPGLSGNQKYIYGIMFSDYQGHIYLVDDSEYMTFEQLMQQIEEKVINKTKQA